MLPFYRRLALAGFLAVVGAGSLLGDAGKPEVAKLEEKNELPKSAIALMGSSRFQHGSIVESVCASKDGKTIMTQGQDQQVRVWDEKGQLKHTVNLAGTQIHTTNMNADALKVAVVDNTGQAINVIDVKTGKTKNIRIEGWIGGLSLAGDGSKLLACGGNQQGQQYATIFDVESGKETQNLEKGGKNRHAQGICGFSGDGKRAVIAVHENNNGAAKFVVGVFDASSGKSIAEIDAPQFGIQTVTLSQDGKTLVLVDGGWNIKVIEVEKQKELRQVAANPQMGAVTCAISPDGKYLLHRSQNQISVDEVAKDKNLKTIECPNMHFVGGNRPNMSFMSEKTVAVAQGPSVRFFDVTTGEEVNAAPGHTGAVLAARFSGDDKNLLTVSDDGTLRQWEARTGKEIKKTSIPVKQRQGWQAQVPLVVSNDGKYFGQVGFDPQTGAQSASLTEVDTKKEVVQYTNQMGIQGMALSADNACFSVASGNQIRLFDAANGKETTVINFNSKAGEKKADGEEVQIQRKLARIRPGMPGMGGQASIMGMAFSPNGKTLAVIGMEHRGNSSVTILRLYEVRSGKERDLIELGGGSNQGFAVPGWGCDARCGVGIGMAQVARCVDCCMPAPVQQSSTLSYAPDGRSIAIGTQGAIILVDLVKRREIRQFGGFASSQATAFSPNGKQFAVGNTQGRITIWDVATGVSLAQKQAHRGPVQTLTYSKDGAMLASGSSDSTAIVWDPAKVIAEEGVAVKETKLPAAEQVWQDLSDNEKSYDTMIALVRSPADAIKILKDRVKAADGLDEQNLKRLVNDLNSDDFETREKAARDLEKLQKLAEPYLRKAVKGELPNLEVRRRLEKILEKLEGPMESPDLLRRLRAVEVLEMIGTPEACAVLETLAKGAEGAPETVDAKKAIEKIKSRN